MLYGSQSNQVGGEFWIGGVRDNIECRAAVSCAHTYGKKSIYAESFTSGYNFRDSPASIKKWCDWVYGVGVNHLILHVYIHQPDERKPGIIQWFGTDFNRHNTWFEQSKGFIDYTRRSSVLLKAGFPVIDVAYYIGENAPMMQGPRDPELPDGYEFDFINSDVLINRSSVKDGRIVVKDGPGYAVLVLPRQKVMRPEVAEAIKRLVGQGATIICPKPVVSPSLENYPVCDETLRKIAGEVWGDLDGKAIKMRKYGKGYVYDGLSLEEVLNNNTININLPMNYWMAESANLSEMHQPLFSFIENLAVTGKITAKTFYGVNKGWASGHNSDIWAMTNPVGDFGKGKPKWANWTMGGTWLVTHLWEHYSFTQDHEFLRTKGYPLMRGAAEFCLEWLVEDKAGNLVTHYPMPGKMVQCVAFAPEVVLKSLWSGRIKH
ncbi:hypothetical protein ES708_17976 [subsurface metagenome]